MTDEIQYSARYLDEKYEYRHVILPNELARLVPRNHFMTETEWRNLGIQQSPGWCHFMVHNPEPNVLLFRRRRKDTPSEANTVTSCGHQARSVEELPENMREMIEIYRAESKNMLEIFRKETPLNDLENMEENINK